MNAYSRATLGAGPNVQPMQPTITAAITPISIDWWLAGEQDIRKYMGSNKESALSYIRSNLAFMVTAFKKLVADGEKKFYYQQAQYVNDQLVKIGAMEQVMQTTYLSSLADQSDIMSLITQIKALQTQLQQFNPDIGQITYLTDLLAYRSSRGETILPGITFTPQFTQDKTPILLTPPAGTPGSNLTVQDDTTPAKSNTLLYVGIAAVAAYFAFKG
jgi:hypothetical protein